MSTLGTVSRGRYTPLNADSTKNPERLLALRGQKGATWFVNSGVSASGNGLSWGSAFETVAEAIAAALAGDLILVAEGHAESTAVAITQSVAGVHVVGLGVGDRRPVITFTADVDWNLNAAGIVLENLVFKNDSDSQAIVIDVNAADCQVRYCELREGASKQFLIGIDINGGAANACDGTQIIGCAIYSIAAGCTEAIEIGEIADSVVIAGCLIDGDFGSAGIHNPTGFVATNLLLQDNIVRNRQTGDHAIEIISACTGMAVDNRLVADTAAIIFDPGSLMCMGNLGQTSIDAVGVAVPGPGEFIPDLGYHITKSHNVATDNVDLFTVTGKNLIRLICGEVTTVLATVTTYSLRVKTANWAICAATTVTSDADDTMYVVTGQRDALLNGGASGVPTTLIAMPQIENDSTVDRAQVITPFVIGLTGGSLTIESDQDQVGTGVIRWDLYYVPLEAGASIVAA